MDLPIKKKIKSSGTRPCIQFQIKQFVEEIGYFILKKLLNYLAFETIQITYFKFCMMHGIQTR